MEGRPETLVETVIYKRYDNHNVWSPNNVWRAADGANNGKGQQRCMLNSVYAVHTLLYIGWFISCANGIGHMLFTPP
jgi:hypothetical protein